MSSRVTAAFVVYVLISVFALLPAIAGADTLTADFIAHDSFTHGLAPFTVSFEDRSVMAASWLWNFGDGQTSTESNPAHTYASPGTYTVTLTIHDMTGTLTSSKTMADYIVVGQDPMHPVATTGALTVSPTSTPVYTTTTVPIPAGTPALTGSVEVVSEPAGAMFSLDGVEQGITPDTAYKVPIGQHTVKVHSKGYVDNETLVTVEYQKTNQLKIILAAVGAGPATTPTTVSATTTVPVTTETTAPEGQKAAAYPGSDPSKAPGSIHVYCSWCLSLPQKFGNHDPITKISYSIIDPATKESVFLNTVYSDQMVVTGLAPGNYWVHVTPMDHESQDQLVTVSPLNETRVQFKSDTFVHSPGFEAFLAIFAIAGIIGIRRYRQ